MKHFKFYSKEDILSLTKIRRFEAKIGERIKHLPISDNWMEAMQQSAAKYVLLGIPEDIGVKANYGTGGADTAWLPFLSVFLNNQSNDFLSGENILLLGHFDFGDIKYLIENNADNPDEMVEAYRHAVNTIDDAVENMIKVITAMKKIPVIIGGGQNNAYPIIKGTAKGLHKADLIPLAQINCINLDAYADFSATDGRHNGNGFHYAEEDGYLGKYCIIGVHENTISQNILLEIHNNPFIDYITYEEIFIHERKNFTQSISHATGFTEDTYTGIELDLNCIEQVLSRDVLPCGISVLQARQYVSFTAQDAKVAYLHISEGATQLADGKRNYTTGKLISYLVSDFIKELSQD